MFVQPTEGGYLVRLERGEELVASLARLMQEEEIPAGAVSGLGAVSEARLGCYEVSRKGYRERRFTGDLEVCALTGTLSWYEGSPFPHLHVVLTGPDFQPVGGHCFEAMVSATLEVFVRVLPERVERRMDEGIGLHLMDLPPGPPRSG